MKRTAGYSVRSHVCGEVVLPASADDETTLAMERDNVVPYAVVDALALVNKHFPGARVEEFKLKRGKR